MFPNITYWPWIETKPVAATFLYKFDLCKFVTFFHWWSRNFLFCKGESGVPRFLFHILLIKELNFVPVYILARYHTYQGEFFASEVAHFLAILKSAIDGSF